MLALATLLAATPPTIAPIPSCRDVIWLGLDPIWATPMGKASHSKTVARMIATTIARASRQDYIALCIYFLGVLLTLGGGFIAGDL